MSMPISYLFVPADSGRKIEKAFASDANVLILDLEDGVALTQKNAARKVLLETITKLQKQQRIGKPFYIRCNCVKSTFIHDDISLIQEMQPQGVMLPKCEFGEDVIFIANALPGIEILPLVENVAGIHRLQRIEELNPSIQRLAFGAVDYALDLGTDWTADGAERDYAMNLLVFYSRLLELAPPVDAVFPVLNNSNAFRNDIWRGKQKGFYGKMAIHPAQLSAIHEAYYLSPEEIRWHRQVVEAYEHSAHNGAFELEGQLIDLPVYRRSRLIIKGIN